MTAGAYRDETDVLRCGGCDSALASTPGEIPGVQKYCEQCGSYREVVGL